MTTNIDIIHKKSIFFESIFGKGNVKLSRDSKNFTVRCPICNKNNGKLKLAIRTIDDLTHCWVCGWKSKSLLPIVLKYFKNKSDEYKTLYNLTKNLDENTDNSLEEKVILPSDFTLLALCSGEEKRKYFNYFAYLKNRGISYEDLWKYKFGVSKEENYFGRIIIPSFDLDGNLNYFTARSLNPNSRIKYMTCGKPKNDVIFNELYIDFKKPIKICEGPFDMIKLGENATCLQGSELNENSKIFQEILHHESDVILCLDSDMKLKSHMIARNFSEYGINIKILDLGDKHDPGELNNQTINHMLYNNCNEYSWEDLIKHKLDQIKSRKIL